MVLLVASGGSVLVVEVSEGPALLVKGNGGPILVAAVASGD